MNCKSCDNINHFYQMKEDTSLSSFNCYKPKEKYYIATHNIQMPCSTGCQTCSGPSSLSSTNCLTCDTANYYYPLATDASNCIAKGIDLYYLYLDTMYPCAVECKTCSGNDTSSKCLTCDTSSKYYPVDSSTSLSCLLYPVDKYYLINNKLYPCHSNCKTCTESGTASNTKCIK